MYSNARYHINDDIQLIHQITEERPYSPEHYLHTHPYCELYFYVRGDCRYMVENGVYVPTVGTVIFTRPGEMHGVMLDTPCTYERYYFHIVGVFAEKIGFPELLRCFF